MRGFYLLVFFCFSVRLFAQDYLAVPSSNPEFFPHGIEVNNDKIFFQQDTVVYDFNTRDLPFIDDFSKDHFPPLVKDPANDPRVTKSRFYAIRINGQVYNGAMGFVGDTTYTYGISLAGDTMSTIENPIQLIQYYDLSKYPPTFDLLNTYPPYNLFDTVGGGTDTSFLAATFVQDSIQYYVVEKDSTSFYLDRQACRSTSMGFYPPSIGVATFDGLNQFGLPYNFDDIAPNGRADNLTSVPIDLSGTSDSTYFSFYYQAKGFALDGPNQNDSLSLEFFNSTTQRWGLVWQKQGQAPTAPVDSFRQEIIRVEPQFRTADFQFRFRNRARLNGAYDNWHIDYIYLDDNRRKTDTAKKDISYVYPATSLLKEYEAMPVWHFKTNPALYMTDSVRLLVRNNFSGPLNVFNKIVIPDTIANNNYYIFPGASQFLQIQPFGSLSLTYPIDFTYPPSAVDTIGVFKGFCDIDFRPAPIETKDFIRGNDSTNSRAVLSNYYAYDDGSAEAGYGINTGSQGGNTSYLAVRFDMPFQDTLGGVQMYFLPQANDIRTQSFNLTVWSSLSPPTIVYQQEVRSRAIFDEKNAYISYFFDTLIVVGPTFYVGYQKIGQLSMNLGYDLNKNHRDKIAWSLNGVEWFAPSNNIRDGSVMLRPILRKKNFGVGIVKNTIQPNVVKESLRPYPNPTNRSFQLLEKPSGLRMLRLMSFDGRLVREFDPNSMEYSVQDLSKGMYILQGIGESGKTYSAKIMIAYP